MEGEKSMPIVYSFTNEDLYIFPSEASLNKFRHADFESDSINLKDVGIPLFQINEKATIARMLGRSSFEIFRFESGRTGYNEEVGAKPVLRGTESSIYKVPFCWISRKSHGSRTVYDFKYHQHINISNHELIHTQDGFFGVLNGAEFKLVSPTGRKDELNLVTNSNSLPVATFTTTDRDTVPRKYSKSASLVIKNFPSDQDPAIVKVLACQALLLKLLFKIRINETEKTEPLPTRSQAWDSLESIREHC